MKIHMVSSVQGAQLLSRSRRD